MAISNEVREAIEKAYAAGLADGFKQGATAALNPVEPLHRVALAQGAYPPAEAPQEASQHRAGRQWRQDVSSKPTLIRTTVERCEIVGTRVAGQDAGQDQDDRQPRQDASVAGMLRALDALKRL